MPYKKKSSEKGFSRRVMKLIERKAKLEARLLKRALELPTLHQVTKDYVRSVSRFIPNRKLAAKVLGVSYGTYSKILAELRSRS